MAKLNGSSPSISSPKASTVLGRRWASPLGLLKALVYGSSSADGYFDRRQAKAWLRFLTTLETHYGTAFRLKLATGISAGQLLTDVSAILPLGPFECAHAAFLLREAERQHVAIAVMFSRLSHDLSERNEASLKKLQPKTSTPPDDIA